MKPDSVESLHLIGPQIFTDGSRIEGKVGAALSWWNEGKERKFYTFRLESHNTVFQSELYALYRAVRMVGESREEGVNILSDSRSSLDLLRSPVVTHPLAAEIMRCLRDIRTQGKWVRLFWLRAHAGTPGNERADELAKNAALKKKTRADYSKVPIYYDYDYIL
ncbi:Non-LTR retrotransposon CATS [Operophtera brumata]|uniref:Non-LTR retrotransposon CATS n=1 Tax=Operophtera brumata TaxID=104452 RepID=A0A0L7LJ45_OPEBR|nr:Non-LTR retrotransposon CATS [Operophtera brumata]